MTDHTTTVTGGRDRESGAWAEWACTCGAARDGYASKADAREEARDHERDNR